MFVLHTFLNAVAFLIDKVLDFYTLVVIVHALLSWVNPDPYNPIVRFVAALSEPLLRPFRRLVPPYKTGGIDISPILLIFVILFLQRFIVPILYHAADRLQ